MKIKKSYLTLLFIGIVCGMGGIVCSIMALILPTTGGSDIAFPQVPSKNQTNEKAYSNLTGLEIAAEYKNAPTFCVQTPNGTDGARPQAGLNQAGVIFEAIAEAGITRFAAIYQNPTAAVIGPIRSLRLYYLEWDTPFDCTIVHAGGADDALAAVKNGGYKDLTENYSYMYRGTTGTRLWNNLFTTADYLKQMNADRNYGESEVHGFTRMTPEEATKDRVKALADKELDITEPSSKNTSELQAKVNEIALDFGNLANYNVRYYYNSTTNSYDRSYESGAKHEIYVCPEQNLGEVNPEYSCTLQQMSPKVVVAIIVKEKKAADNYHESITTLGSGDVYIFQNGYAVKGIWKKNTADEQIKFYNADGFEIKLVPGQTFIEAVPNYGSIAY